jgi:hypothetical protein
VIGKGGRVNILNSRGDDRSWTTMAECEFLEKVGGFSAPESRGGDSYHVHRVKCLEGYLKGLDKRTDWGKIDKEKVRRKAEVELNKMLHTDGKEVG